MSPTQKILFIILLLAGAAVWSYNSLLLLSAWTPTDFAAPPDWRPAPTPPMAGLTTRPDTTRIPYTGDFPDPFAPTLRIAPARPARPAPPPHRAPAQPLPKLTLLGILWSASNPIATVQLADGHTENLRVGMQVEGATVTRIEQAAVILRAGDKTMRLTSPGPRL